MRNAQSGKRFCKLFQICNNNCGCFTDISILPTKSSSFFFAEKSIRSPELAHIFGIATIFPEDLPAGKWRRKPGMKFGDSRTVAAQQSALCL